MDSESQRIVRLNFISETDIQYYQDIMDFLQEAPEFEPYAYLSTLENPEKRTLKNLKDLKTLKDHLIFYVSQSALSPSYGLKVYNWVISGDLSHLTAKKLGEIRGVLDYPDYDSIKTVQDLDNLKIKGVGEGAKLFVRQFFFKEKNICIPSERKFQKGLSIVLKNKVSAKDAKKISDNWNKKYIGNMLCLQIGDYIK